MRERRDAMTRWYAISYGALDLRDLSAEFPGVEIAVIAVHPSEPHGLVGGVADLWLSLGGAGRADTDLDVDEREQVSDFESAGLATTDQQHPNRVGSVSRPWMTSVLHELTYGLVASVARSADIEVVFIKGPVLHRQGLRDREHSGDVDVWVDPANVTRLAQLVEDWGWRRADTLWSEIASYHSVTLVPRAWGPEVDLHRHMPGCALDDSALFRLLIASTSMEFFAGVNGRVPHVAAHAVISALHTVRPTRGEPFKNEDLSHQAAETLRLAGSAAAEWAEESRAVASLLPVLQSAFPERPFTPNYPPPENWTRRAIASRGQELVALLRTVPLKQKPRIFLRIVWPSRTDIERSDMAAGGLAHHLIWARFRRLARGMRPSTWRATHE